MTQKEELMKTATIITEHKNTLLSFIKKTRGLRVKNQNLTSITIEQKEDKSFLKIFFHQISHISLASETKKEDYIQINFINKTKCILTESLIGFAPIKSLLLDKNSLPEVVSSIDLLNILEAFEANLRNSGEIEDFLFLNQVYHAVLNGGKHIGLEWDFNIPGLHSLGLSSQILN